MTWPFFTCSPLLHQNFLVDAGRGVRAHEFADRINLNAVFRIVLNLLFRLRQLAVLGDDDLVAGDGGDLAASSATTTARESRATRSSRPVATSGASVTSSGTAWRCMFEPINARFASSCSRNGISDAAIETSCFGETSM